MAAQGRREGAKRGGADEAPVIPRLYSLTRPYRSTVIIGMICLVISVAAELYPPLIWQAVVDEALPQNDWNRIIWEVVLLVGVLGVGQLFSAIRGVLLERAGQQLTFDLRMRLYSRLQEQPASFYATRRTGDLLSRLNADVEAIQDVLIRGTDSVVANALRLFGVAGIFIALQPQLGIMTVMPMIAVGLLLTRFNGQVRPVYRAARERLGELTARLADNLGGMRVIQSFAQERREIQALEVLGRKLLNDQVEAVRLRNKIFPLIRWVGSFGNAIMLAGGVYFIARGEFTLGGLLAYRGYGRYFFGPVDDLVSINDLVQRAAAAGRRVFEVLDSEPSIQNAPQAQALAKVRGELHFDNITFGYDPNRPVLRGVSLHVRPGERVAILGPSGAGKSTLLALAARMYDPDQGRVLLDGHDLREVTLESLRSQTAQVQQETYLFNATALENLRYGNRDASQAEVERAARAANAHDFLEGLPQGYATLVGERGIKLSGGQKQRIAVARALLTESPLLLLDEPTSAVEPESEALIIAGLERLMEGRTTLIVSHRLSLARAADRVVIVEHGQIVEEGPPQELLARGGRFARMVAIDQADLADNLIVQMERSERQ